MTWYELSFSWYEITFCTVHCEGNARKNKKRKKVIGREHETAPSNTKIGLAMLESQL